MENLADGQFSSVSTFSYDSSDSSQSTYESTLNDSQSIYSSDSESNMEDYIDVESLSDTKKSFFYFRKKDFEKALPLFRKLLKKS